MYANSSIINTWNLTEFNQQTEGKWAQHTCTHTSMQFSNHSGWENVNKPVAWCCISYNKAFSVSLQNSPSGALKLDSVKMVLWCLWGQQLRSLAWADWLSPQWREVTWQSAQLAIWSPTATVTKWSPTSSGQWGNQTQSLTHTETVRLHTVNDNPNG